MKAKPRSAKSRKKPDQGAAIAAPLPARVEPSVDTTVPPEKLTPEEQMERFAKELKNEDWGHQPC